MSNVSQETIEGIARTLGLSVEQVKGYKAQLDAMNETEVRKMSHETKTTVFSGQTVTITDWWTTPIDDENGDPDTAYFIQYEDEDGDVFESEVAQMTFLELTT